MGRKNKSGKEFTFSLVSIITNSATNFNWIGINESGKNFNKTDIKTKIKEGTNEIK